MHIRFSNTSLPQLQTMTENLRLTGQRLKEYMQTRGLSIAGVARMSDFSSKELDAMVDGEPYPLSRLMPLLALFDDLNPTWLLRGEGAMLLKGIPRPKPGLAENLNARQTLRRQAIVPVKADPGLGQRVAALEIELVELRALVAKLSARQAKKSARRAAAQ